RLARTAERSTTRWLSSLHKAVTVTCDGDCPRPKEARIARSSLVSARKGCIDEHIAPHNIPLRTLPSLHDHTELLQPSAHTQIVLAAAASPAPPSHPPGSGDPLPHKRRAPNLVGAGHRRDPARNSTSPENDLHH